MNVRRAILIGGALLIAVQTSLAQFHAGEHRRETTVTPTNPSGPTPETSDSGIRNFERVVALQAAPDQIAQFRRMKASTKAARNKTQEILSALPATPGNAYTLANQLQEAGWENEKFLDSFSREQNSGLKRFTRKMRKADAELDRHAKALQDLDFSAAAAGDILVGLQKLDKTLSELQSQQLAIANEMGIQDSTSKQQ